MNIKKKKFDNTIFYYLDVTEIFKKMMGNFVKEAWTIAYINYDDSDKLGVTKIKENISGIYKRFLKVFHKDKTFDVPFNEVYILFDNGNIVRIEFSEWGIYFKRRISF